MESVEKVRRRFDLNIFMKKFAIFLIITSFSLLSVAFIFKVNNFIFNVSESLPIGIYKVISKEEKYQRNDYVVARIPLREQNFVFSRGYLSYKTGEPKTILKKIKGVEGDVFEVKDKNSVVQKNKFLIRNHIDVMAEVFEKDSQGRPLPTIEKTILKENEYFLLGDHPQSMDSRYLGVFKAKDILYKVKPVFTF